MFGAALSTGVKRNTEHISPSDRALAGIGIIESMWYEVPQATKPETRTDWVTPLQNLHNTFTLLYQARLHSVKTKG